VFPKPDAFGDRATITSLAPEPTCARQRAQSAQQNPVPAAVGPGGAGSYSVTASVNGCSSPPAVTGVVVNPLPTALVSGSPAGCSGAPEVIQAALTGTPPWNLTWSDGVSQTGVTASSTMRSVAPAASSTYTVTAISDAVCQGTAAGSAVVTINTPPVPAAGSDGPACAGQDVHLTAQSVQGASFRWSGPGSFSSSAQSPVLQAAQPAASGTYTVIATFDGCASPAATTNVLVTHCNRFFTVTPCRIVDTRAAAGPLGGPALLPSSVREFLIAGSCGIPADAQAISVNVTITQAGAAGDLRLYSSDLANPPLVSNINWLTGEIRANNAMVRMPADGSGSIDVRVDSPGGAHFILDVNGYFQ
jgi:hypothetical protein